MTLKWIGRILYFILVLFGAIFIVQLGIGAKNNSYYVNDVQPEWDNTQQFLTGISTIYAFDYFQEDAFYTYSKNEEDISFDLNIYAIGGTYGEEFYDGFIILINHVEIYENDTLIENPLVKITIDLTENTYLTNDDLTSQFETIYDPENDSIYATQAYNNIPAVRLFYAPGHLINTNDTDDVADDIISTVNRITIDYSNRETDEDGNYIFNYDHTDKYLFIASTTDTVDESIYKETFTIEDSHYKLSEQFSDDTYTDDDIDTLNLVTDHGDLSPYNWQLVNPILIYLLFAITFTYLIFFHKHVMAKIRAKKQTTSNLEEKAIVEPIFKDIEPSNEKDGK